MRFGGRLAVAFAVILAALLAWGPPASAKAYKPEIREIEGPIAGGLQFTITVDTLGTESGEQVSVQTYQRSAWRTVGRQPAEKYAGIQKFTITAPSSTQTLRLRATLTRGNQLLSTSKTRSVEVWATGLTPDKPHPAQAAGRPGAWFAVGKDALLFGPTLSGAEAWKVVSADTLVTKPSPGWSIVLGTVNYKTPATEWNQLWPDVYIEYRGNDGKTYRPGDVLTAGGYCSYSLDLSSKTGDPSTDLYPVEPGAYPQFYPCAVVPDAAISGGVWQIRSLIGGVHPERQYAQAAGTPEPSFPKGLTPLNPYHAKTSSTEGDWFEIHFFAGNYGVQFGATVTGEEAWRLLDGPQDSVAHPASGWSIVLVSVTLQNRTDHDAAPFQNIIGPDFVGNDGVRYVRYNVFSAGGDCPYSPSYLFGRSLEARGSLTFTGCAVVPDSAIAGGVWQVGPFDPFVIPQSVYVQSAR